MSRPISSVLVVPGGSLVKNIRCDRCRHWARLGDVTTVSCPACTFTAVRCRKGGCGGVAGALRSIRSHFVWWAVRGHQDGGHAEKLRRAVQYFIRNWRQSVTKRFAAPKRRLPKRGSR